MKRYIECSICHTKYTGEGSIKLALQEKENYLRACQEDGYNAKGICPCPVFNCKGEMVLHE